MTSTTVITPLPIAFTVIAVIAGAVIVACGPLLVAGLRARREHAVLTDDIQVLAAFEPSAPDYDELRAALAHRSRRSLERAAATERYRDVMSSLRWAWVCAVGASTAAFLTSDEILGMNDLEGWLVAVTVVLMIATVLNLASAAEHWFRLRRSPAKTTTPKD